MRKVFRVCVLYNFSHIFILLLCMTWDVECQMSVNGSIHLDRNYNFIGKENNEKTRYIFNSPVALRE